MPQVTVYVRKEDLDKWKAIEQKSEFIHAALNNTAPDVMVPIGPQKAVKITNNPKTVNEFVPEPVIIPKTDGTTLVTAHTEESLEKAVKSIQKEKNFDFCKHDQVKGMCKFGCK